MNELESIEKKANTLRRIFWMVLLMQVVVFLFVVFVGVPIGAVAKETLVPIQGATVLYTLAMIPLSLKLFQLRSAKIDASMPLNQRLERYSSLYLWRLAAISSIPLLNECLYLFSDNKSELTMALIGALALAFCMTSAQQIKIELKLIQDDAAES
jgi:ABC-type antimicrobial peptide transport system permease subunit